MYRGNLLVPPQTAARVIAKRQPGSNAAPRVSPCALHPISRMQQTLGNRRVAQLIRSGRVARDGWEADRMTCSDRPDNEKRSVQTVRSTQASEPSLWRQPDAVREERRRA